MEKQAEFLTVKDVAQFFGVTEITVYRWATAKFIPHYKLGGAIRFDRNEVLDWAKKRGSGGRIQEQ